MKRYINYSIVYAILAMIGGVFYREFTKMNDYTAWTTLSVVHTHFFILYILYLKYQILRIILRHINRVINLIQYIVSNIINIHIKLFGYKLHTSQKRLVIYGTHIAANLIIIFIKLFITVRRSLMTSPHYVDTAFLF